MGLPRTTEEKIRHEKSKDFSVVSAGSKCSWGTSMTNRKQRTNGDGTGWWQKWRGKVRKLQQYPTLHIACTKHEATRGCVTELNSHSLILTAKLGAWLTLGARNTE